MRHDLDDAVKEQRIRDFLGLCSFTLKRYNLSSDKVYSEAYRDFLEHIRLPRAYVERMLDSKYAHHFFGESERQRWTGHPAPRAEDNPV